METKVDLPLPSWQFTITELPSGESETTSTNSAISAKLGGLQNRQLRLRVTYILYAPLGGDRYSFETEMALGHQRLHNFAERSDIMRFDLLPHGYDRSIPSFRVQKYAAVASLQLGQHVFLQAVFDELQPGR